MKVVLDTNVLISGIFFSGPPAGILAAWAGGRFELVASVEVLAEYRRVAERLHKKFSSIDINAILDLVTRETRIVEPVPVPVSACDDPDDLKFLACALAGGASFIVTGDRALLRASGFQGLAVVTPREFLRHHLER
ncbi:MAG: putative toxin-antitoxin system toxin component, PIN family [bacterium]